MRNIVMGLFMAGSFFLGSGPARATVDPQCILQARDDFMTCKDECRTSYRDDKFRCRNVEPMCGNACLAGRERCLEPYLQVLTDCIDHCKDDLRAGRQQCASNCGCTLGSSCTSNCCNDGNKCYNDCLDPYQVAAFVCRDNCRESFHNDEALQENIRNCRASFRACVATCPPATP